MSVTTTEKLSSVLSSLQVDYIRDSCQRSFQLESFEVTDETLTVCVRDTIETNDLQKELRKLLSNASRVNSKPYFEHKGKRLWSTNPQSTLEENELVQKIGRGIYSFQGDFLSVFRKLDDFMYSRAMALNSIEQEYPTLWPIELYKKINYFEDYPQQVILCTSVKKTRADLKAIATKYEKKRDFASVTIDDHFDAAEFGLESAVCSCCYFAQRKKMITKNSVYTCRNKVFRHETSEIDSLDRLINFTVRDIMYVGTKEFVAEMQQKVFNEAIQFIRHLDLDSQIVPASDPFFADKAIVKNTFQFASESKSEIVVPLEFCNKKMAIGSINNHMDYFGRSFEITLENGSSAYSGCFGIGFERLTYALFCQYGPVTDQWPKSIREFLELEK